MIPIWGTYKEAEDLYNNPSLEQAGWTALSALGDASMIIPLVGPEIKAGLTTAKAASKAAKVAKFSKPQRVARTLKKVNKARAAQHSKTMQDITYPAMYPFLVRPTGVALSVPYRMREDKSNSTYKNLK